MTTPSDSSGDKRTRSTIRSVPVRRRRRRRALDAEIRRSAQQIYKQGYAEAMKAAALMIVARKLDEIKSLLVATGLSSDIPYRSTTLGTNVATLTQPSPPAPAPIKNPCVNCGRPGVYKTKPNQFNKTGSWYCRAHMALGTSTDIEDQMDRVITPANVPVEPPSVRPPFNVSEQPAPGASSLAEAMGLAEIVNEQS